MKDVRERRKNPMARYALRHSTRSMSPVTPRLDSFSYKEPDPFFSSQARCISAISLIRPQYRRKIFSCGYTADELRGMIGKKTDENFVVVASMIHLR